MSTKRAVDPKLATVVSMPEKPQSVSKPLGQYGCGSIELAGGEDAFYERHLVFDNVIDLKITECT